MAKTGTQLKRYEVPHFEGVNTLVADNISKKQEFSYAENARSTSIGAIEKRAGTRRLGDSVTATATYGLFFFDNDAAANTGIFRVIKVGATTAVYYLNSSSVWTALTGGGTGLTAATIDHVIADGNCFFVNGTDANKYIKGTDGTTVVAATSTSGHLYGSPAARKINYYKGRLYVADYTATTRYKTSVMMSSPKLGIVSLVDGDHAVGSTSLSVTDTKYIRATDSLDIYRGSTKIQTITVSAKTEDTLTITASTSAINSADEIWVAGTYTGERLHRWADNPADGENVKQYDTFKISGGQEDRIKMLTNIGNTMMIANDNNISVWDNRELKSMDLNIGCVSDTGWVKALGTLWFIHYTGIYATTSDRPRLMSAKVEKIIEGASKANLQAAAAGTKGMSVFFSIGNSTIYNADGSVKKTMSDVVLEYDMRQENWYVHTGIKATHFATYISSSDANRLEFASTETGYHTYEFLNGRLDNQITADKEIPFRIDTHNISLGSGFERICYPQQVIIETERGSNIKCFASLDNDEFYELPGDAKKGVTILKFVNKTSESSSPPRCRKVKLSIRDSSNSLCRISRLALVYAESLEEEDDTRQL